MSRSSGRPASCVLIFARMHSGAQAETSVLGLHVFRRALPGRSMPIVRLLSQ